MARNQREVDLPEESDAPPDLRGAFWSLVALFNAAVLAVSVGAMLLGFRGRLTAGGGLLVAGAIAFAVGVYRLRRVRDRLGENEEPSAET